MKKWVLGLLSALLLLTACGGKEVKTEVAIDKEESADLSYELVTATRGDVTSSVTVSVTYGTSETENYFFTAQNGKIEFINVERGDRVKKGDILASLESEGLEAKVEDYDHKLKTKELELKQLLERRDFEIETEEYLFSYTKKTDKDRENTDKAIENIKFAYAMRITTYEDEITILKLRLKEAKEEFEASRIISGVNGVVTLSKTNLEGQKVTQGEVIIKVSDERKFCFTSIESSKAEYFSEGTEYIVTVGHGEKAREYVVKPVNLSTWKGVLYFETLGETDTLSLNEIGKITIVLEEAKDVITIPTAALHKSGKEYFVYYLDENAVRRMKWVTPGLESSDRVEIREGLVEGEYIIK